MFYKKDALNNFAIFTGKHLKPCNFVKKRLQHKCFPMNIAKFLRTPLLKNICELLLLHLFLIKTRDAFAAVKLFIKKALIGQVLLSKLVGVMAHVFVIREATVFTFKDPSG